MTSPAPSIQIRELIESDAEALWHLRLHALESDASAFGQSVEEHKSTPLSKYVGRLQSSAHGKFAMGAFDSSRLIGMAGFYRDQNVKERHKGHIWGVFVDGRYRGKGIGAALIASILDAVRRSPEIEQVQLAVATSRSAARGLYAKFGFRSFGIEKHALRVDETYIDEEHMVLFL